MTDRIVNTIVILLVLALLLGGGVILIPKYRDFQRSRHDLVDLKERLRTQQQEMAELQREIEALKGDYRAIERVAREKFGYCRDNETIYHFEPDHERGSDTPVPDRR